MYELYIFLSSTFVFPCYWGMKNATHMHIALFDIVALNSIGLKFDTLAYQPRPCILGLLS